MLDIVNYPDNILTTKTRELSPEEIKSSEVQDLIDEMIKTCINANGAGLAANQVGNGISLCIYLTNEHLFEVLINPVITKQNGHITRVEGCLSLPGQAYRIKRFKQIVVKGLDRDAKPVTIKTKSKNVAVRLQHEIDHLNGILICNK